MNCEESGLEASDLGVQDNYLPVNRNTSYPENLAPNFKDVKVSIKGLTSRLWDAPGVWGLVVPPHLSMTAKWKFLTASWISVTGHLAKQLRGRKSLLDEKCSGNIRCIPSPNNFILKHFISKSGGETPSQTVSNQAFTASCVVRTSLCEAFAVEPNAFPL